MPVSTLDCPFLKLTELLRFNTACQTREHLCSNEQLLALIRVCSLYALLMLNFLVRDSV